MIDDILTIVWKERKGIFRHRGSRMRFLLVLVTPFALAIVLPLQWGADWVNQVPAVILSILVPIIIVGITVPESFAGERERHTLSTLLASRLPDRAILFGKLAVSVAFAWGMAMLMVLLSLVSVNIVHSAGTILLYKPSIAAACLVLSFLMATLSAGAGVIISMRSATVQEASQSLMAIFLIPGVLLQLVLVFMLEDMIDFVETLDPTQVLLIVIAMLVLLDLTVYAITLRRFNRARLIAD